MNQQTKKLLSIGVFVIVAVGIVRYTTQAVGKASLPFWDERLSWLTYLATKVSDCATCNIVQYYRDAKGSCDITIATLSSTLETRTSPWTYVMSVSSQSLAQRLEEKWASKYIFDVQSSKEFWLRCHTFSS